MLADLLAQPVVVRKAGDDRAGPAPLLALSNFRLPSGTLVD
jgi:hypothetical protein